MACCKLWQSACVRLSLSQGTYLLMPAQQGHAWFPDCSHLRVGHQLFYFPCILRIFLILRTITDWILFNQRSLFATQAIFSIALHFSYFAHGSPPKRKTTKCRMEFSWVRKPWLGGPQVIRVNIKKLKYQWHGVFRNIHNFILNHKPRNNIHLTHKKIAKFPKKRTKHNLPALITTLNWTYELRAPAPRVPSQRA